MPEGQASFIITMDVLVQIKKEAKRYFENAKGSHDWEHTERVYNLCMHIGKEENADVEILTLAAILHDIGIQEAESKYDSSAGKYQEIEGPPIAQEILKSCNVPARTIEHICGIIANHHTARDIDTLEFRIIWDADNLVNLQEELKDKTREQMEKIIKKVFKTSTGHRMASELLIKR